MARRSQVLSGWRSHAECAGRPMHQRFAKAFRCTPQSRTPSASHSARNTMRGAASRCSSQGRFGRIRRACAHGGGGLLRQRVRVVQSMPFGGRSHGGGAVGRLHCRQERPELVPQGALRRCSYECVRYGREERSYEHVSKARSTRVHGVSEGAGGALSASTSFNTKRCSSERGHSPYRSDACVRAHERV